MKKVIFEPKEAQTVSVSDVDSDKTYGCRTPSAKMILIEVGGGYYWAELSELFNAGTEAEHWFPMYESFEGVFEQDGSEYFEFESYEEAAKWLSDE